MKEIEYYIPAMRYQLVDILSRHYPKDRFKFKKMNKKQLYAIYHSVLKEAYANR